MRQTVNTEELKLHFPHPSLTKIEGRPKHTTIQVLRQKIYENAAAISSSLGGGGHGHLGLVMNDDEYQNISLKNS